MTTTTASKPFKKGYKYRLYPTPEQRQFLIETFGANRFLWNHAQDMKQKEYRQYLQDKKDHPGAIHARPELSGYCLHSLIPGIKEQFEWMRLYSNVAIYDRQDSRSQPVESSCLWRRKPLSVSVKQESQLVTAGNPLPEDRGGCQGHDTVMI